MPHSYPLIVKMAAERVFTSLPPNATEGDLLDALADASPFDVSQCQLRAYWSLLCREYLAAKYHRAGSKRSWVFGELDDRCDRTLALPTNKGEKFLFAGDAIYRRK